MSNLKGSRIENNLLTAFAGESQTRNRYTYFASKAKKEGFGASGIPAHTGIAIITGYSLRKELRNG